MQLRKQVEIIPTKWSINRAPPHTIVQCHYYAHTVGVCPFQPLRDFGGKNGEERLYSNNVSEGHINLGQI